MSQRSRRPLYPMAWGAGKKAFEATYKCYSVAAAGRDDLENGDKILMPEKAFREVSRLRLKFPLTMMAKNPKKSGPPSQSRSVAIGGRRGSSNGRAGTRKKSSGNDPFIQYCGVLEFSSPEGVCHLPHWMMESLNLREGGRVTLRSAPPLPKGDFARFQPHKEEFLDFAMALGVRNVLELAMQHYSALAVGQTVLIQYGNDKYFLDVIEVNPGSAISLYGTVDLKVEFAPVAGSAAALAAAAANKENNVDDDASTGTTSSEDSPPASSTRRTSRGPTTPASKREPNKRARPRPGATNRSTRTSPITPRGTTKGRGASNGSRKSGARTSASNASGAASPPSPNSTAAIQAMQKRRQDKLSKFRKRGSLSRAVDGSSGTTNAGVVGSSSSGSRTGSRTTGAKQSSSSSSGRSKQNAPLNQPATSPVQPQRLGRSLASGASVPLHTTDPSTLASNKETKEETTTTKPATWGTGYTLNSSSVVHSDEPIAPPPSAPSAAETKTAEAPSETKSQTFSGKGATLGGGSSSSGNGGSAAPAATPWAAAARARHERYAKKQAEEGKKKAAEEATAKKEMEEKCRAIAEAAAAAMSEQEKLTQAKKDELEAKRLAIESQIEDKLLRDAELKRKREEKRERAKRDRADRSAAMDQQVEDLEALALAHAVQQSVESDVKGRRRTKRRQDGDVEDAMLNAALMESTKAGSNGGNVGKFDNLLNSARSEQRPRAPSQNNVRGVTPPDGRKKRGASGGGGLLQRYEKQLGFLREMGFDNAIEASTALEASGGDVQRAVELLTGKSISPCCVVLYCFHYCFIIFGIKRP